MEEEKQFINEDTACVSFIHQNIVVEAIVKIKPRVIIGEDFHVECGDSIICKIDNRPPKRKSNPRRKKLYSSKYHCDLCSAESSEYCQCHEEDDDCSFLVKQELCLRIPLIFTAKAIVESEKAVCLDTCVESSDIEED